ncbi:MAG TPA: hypothetical protein VM428_00150 [Microlunatus sp.]|nr:hypothetical protein [Microlunatus sp.]
MMLLEVDPNLVRPGWTPLVVIVLLGIVLFFLGRSMLKQFGRIDVPADHRADPEAGSESTGSKATGSDGEPSAGDVPQAPIPDLRAPTRDGGRAAPPDQR